MDVSIGIMTHNDSAIVENLKSMHRQKTDSVNIKEIIVVSSSNERINESIRSTQGIRLIVEDKREGKSRAINKFLKTVKSNIVVVCSGDVVPEPEAIEQICLPLQDPKVGIVACRPIPARNKSFIWSIVDIQWKVHHLLSLRYPKYGEMIAFRKVFSDIDDTAADEEFIAMKIYWKGLEGRYNPKSRVCNRGPASIKDFLMQKRRIYWGHLELKKKHGYTAASMRNAAVAREYLRILRIENIHTVLCAMALESVARFLGMVDYCTGKRHYVWKIVKTHPS